MKFAFTEDQLLFRDAVSDLLRKECTPAVVRNAWSNASGRSDGIWAQLTEQGVIGLTVPEAHGGLEMTELDLVLLLEAAGTVALPEPFVETSLVAAPVLARAGGEASGSWLERIAAGEATAAVGFGDDPVAGAAEASLLLLADNDALYLVTPEQASLQAQVSVDRSRRLATVQWTPDTALKLGGAELRTAAFDRATLGYAAQLVGLGQAMLDLTVDYAGTRRQFGVPIGSFQAIKHHLASALVKLAFARPMVYRAAYSLAHNDPEASTHVSMAKHYAGEAATLMSKTALQCHGAIGYTTEYDLHMWMKRAWALNQACGDPQWHRNRVAETILGPRVAT